MNRLVAASRWLAWFVLGLSWCTTSLFAQPREFQIEVGAERSWVSLNGADSTWSVDRVELSYLKPGRDGVFFSAERHGRFDKSDVVFSMSGYQRLGDWTVSARAGVTPAADFYWRYGAEGEVGRRIAGRLVGQLGYRYLRFAGRGVRLVMPAATWYFRRGEVEGRGFLSQRTQSFLVRGAFEVSSTWRIGVGSAYGDGIFDVTSLAGPAARGFILYGTPEVRLGPRNRLGVTFSLGREDPSFERRTLGFYYRRVF